MNPLELALRSTLTPLEPLFEFKNPFTAQDFPRGSFFYVIKLEPNKGVKVLAERKQVGRIVNYKNYWDNVLTPEIDYIDFDSFGVPHKTKDWLEWSRNSFVLKSQIYLQKSIKKAKFYLQESTNKEGLYTWGEYFLIPEIVFKAIRGNKNVKDSSVLYNLLGTGSSELDRIIKSSKIVLPEKPNGSVKKKKR